MADRSDDYEVGYGKPPKHSQFAPGQSGNKGRRKKPEGPAELIARLRDEPVEVNGKRMTKLELAIIQTINQTIRLGKPRELKALFELLDRYGAMPSAEAEAMTRQQSDEVFAKIFDVFYKTEDIDPADVDELERLNAEEAKLVMSCSHCGPTLKKAWGEPERKALAKRYGRTALHKEVVDPPRKIPPFKGFSS